MFSKCRKSCNACQEETTTRVNSYTQGYTTSSGACARASLGATVKVKMDLEITATTQKNIETLGSSIKNHLKEEFKSNFSAEIKAGYSLDVGFKWLGVRSDGHEQESEYVEFFESGQTSLDAATKEFLEAIKETNSKRVEIVGEATVEGRSPIPTEYCMFYDVERVEFQSNELLFVVNDDPNSARTATSDGTPVPNKDMTLAVIYLGRAN